MRTFRVKYTFFGSVTHTKFEAENQTAALMHILKITSSDGIHVNKNLTSVMVTPVEAE